MLFFTFFSNKVDLSTNKLKQAISTFPDARGIGATRSVQCSQERPGERGELMQRAVDGVGVGDAARGMGTRRCESEQKKQIKNKKGSYLSRGTDGC